MTTSNSSSPRYLELDAMRGFAVMGILLMNIVGFAMPDMAYFSPAIYGGTETPDAIAWALSFIFVDGKMRGLFTLLFGASMMLVIDRAEATGQNPAKVHYARMGWLALFGLLHFFLLWFGDILFLYASIGCIAFFMADFKPAKLYRIALLIYVAGFVVYAGMMGSLLYLEQQVALPNPSAMQVGQFNDAMKDFKVSAKDTADKIALYQSGFLDIAKHKLSESTFSPLASILQNIMETLPFMMIGMGLFKQGFFTGQWQPIEYRRWGVLLSVIGALLLLPQMIYLWQSGFDLLLMLNANLAWSMPSRLLMTVGYAALMIMLIQKFAGSGWMHRVAAVGRAAFTNYLGTSIVMTFIFYGWGLGLFGQIGRAELYLFVVGMWVAMLIWSKPWLTRFRYGPLEWLWRSLARLELQPMRITK